MRRASVLRQASAIAVAGVALVAPLALLPGPTATALAGALHFAALLVATWSMARAARSGDAEAARSRWALTAALVAVAAGSLIGLGFTLATGSIPVPSIADPVSLAWVPLAMYGFWKVPRRGGAAIGAGDLRRLTSDGAVAVAALLFASYLWVLEPLAATGRWTAAGEAVEFTYPILDVLVAAVVVSLLPRARADLRPFLNCVAGGLTLVVVSDSGSVLLLGQRGVAAYGWPDLPLQAGMMLLAFAARLRRAPTLTAPRASSALDRNLPYLPVGLAGGLGLLHVWLVTPLNLAESALGAVMLVAIVWRQMLFGAALAATAETHRTASDTDALTGLANRKAFLGRLCEYLATPGTGPASVVLFDLDGFKEINDTLGHDAGDQVLVGFGDVLAAHAAGGHLAARLGGDEFALFVVSAGDPEAAGQKIAQDVNAAAATLGTGIAASAGLARLLPEDTPSSVMRRADLAMYAAKRAGKDHGGSAHNVCVFTDTLAARADRRSLLLSALPDAANRGELHLVYQPLFRLNDGTLIGAEALLRWEHPLLGAIGPDEFIPLAEDSGHIVAIGQWVREHAIAQVAAWEQQGRFLPRLFINVAAREFGTALPDDVARLLAHHHLQPDRLALEVTESKLPTADGVHIMTQLRGLGVHLALDDFGTGYSSLAQLAHLPVDILKIDRKFMAHLGEQAAHPILDTIVSLGRSMHLTTVAEGVEHLAQAAEANNIGLDHAQGYLFSRPVAPEDLAPQLPTEAPTGRIPTPREPAVEAAPAASKHTP